MYSRRGRVGYMVIEEDWMLVIIRSVDAGMRESLCNQAKNQIWRKVKWVHVPYIKCNLIKHVFL